MEYIVYLTVNKKNKKIYVGVHGTNIKKFDGYIGNGIYVTQPNTYKKSKTLFQRAVNKYGPDSFIRVTLRSFDNEQDAYKLEAKIVDEKFLEREDVYNTALGGFAPDRRFASKKIYQYDINGNFINEYESCFEAGRQLKVHQGSIKSAQNGHWLYDKCYWLDLKIDKINFDEYKIAKNGKSIYCYNEKGDFIKEYETVKLASESFNKGLQHIIRAAQQGYSVEGIYFSYEKDENYSIARKKYLDNCPIHQYNEEGEYIKSFNSITEAMNSLEKKENILRSIRDCILVSGFRWSFNKVDKIKKNTKSSITKTTRKVGQYNINGELVKIYDSVSKCRKDFPAADRVLIGTRKQSKGYTFKYLD